MKVDNRILLLIAGVLLLFPFSAFANCNSPANAIEAENCHPGSPQSQWDIQSSSDAGSPTIQGFATDISANVGQTVFFKIDTPSTAYRIDIYRMGYYGGMGARLIASILPSAKLPQTQPACLKDPASGLVDCGNWAISASWQVPANATSGIYFAHLVRTDAQGDSHIVFIVRNDASHSDILFQTSDESWQAYNGYAGGSLYGPSGEFDLSGRAYKVSYNRPFSTRAFGDEAATWVFGAEYPMVRWLEANGYDVTYFTGVDAARNGNLITNHKIYLSVGHDEYWSGQQRANVEAARDAGVNLAFFSGNEVFWKTRWENSIDGTNTAYRTMVCYKETLSSTPIDPLDPPTWTGTWRDARFSPPADGGRPENSLTGTLFVVNGPGLDNPGTLSIKVPAADGKMRFWRNTSLANLAPGTTASLPAQTLGYEWDIDADNGFRSPGTFDLSTATYQLTSDLLLDQGATYGAGTATHHMTLHRASSGALVFGAGTVQWSWGLDDNHDDPFGAPQAPDPDMQQATVNLFADMGVQPATLQAGVVRTSASADTVPPSSVITSPSNGATLSSGSAVTITGTAADSGGGVVGGVEVSVDGGSTWHPATGREAWTYLWQPSGLGAFSLESRAVDDSGNLEVPAGTGSMVTVNPPDCPCSDWNANTIPSQVDSGDASSVDVGVRFRSDFDGYITAIRFYKASTNTGTHIGNIWTNDGMLLASATFTNETASGWQQVNFSKPVGVTAGVTYVASYFAPSGHYSDTPNYFLNSGADAPPIHFLADGVDGHNGIFSYSGNNTFPQSSFLSSNYWVDVVFVPASSMPGAPPALLLQPGSLNFVGFVPGNNPPSQLVTVYNEGDGTLTWSATANQSWLKVSPSSGTTPYTFSVSADTSGLAPGTYTGTISVSSSGATNPAQIVSVTLVVKDALLVSTFDDGTMSGWVFSPFGSPAGWSVSNQALHYSGGGNTQIYTGNSAWTNYALDVNFRLSSLNDWPGGIRGRMNPATGAGYVVWAYPAQGWLVLYRTNAWDINQGLVELGFANVKLDTTSFHDLALSFAGSQIQVSYDQTTVITASDGTYTNGLIALEGDNQAITFDNVAVTAPSFSPATLAASPNSLSFNVTYHGSNPAPQTVQLTTSGGVLPWTAGSTASWLTVSPNGANSPASLQISAATSNLNPGNYSAVVNVVSLGTYPNTTQPITVNLTVVAPPPSLVVAPAAMTLVALNGQSSSSQNISVDNGSFGPISWTAAASAPWIVLSTTSGSTPQTLNVSANTTGLAVGSYNGTVTISSSGVSNSPVSIPLTLQVLNSDLTENFADQANGWMISPLGHSSGWTATNGTYSYAGLGLSQSCAGNAAWSDYTFDTTIQLASLSDWPGGVRARVNPLNGSGYAVWLYPGSGKAVLYRVPQWDINNSGATELAEAPLSFDTTVHDLRLDFNGATISASWDGNLLMSATDSTYTNGFICLDGDTQPIAYSNIKVNAIQSQATFDALNPSSLAFSVPAGSTGTPQTIHVSAGSANTVWVATSNVPWLSLQASSSITPGDLTATASAVGLSQGTYTGVITLTAPGVSNSPVSVPVTLAVGVPVLVATPGSLQFFGATGLNPTPQTVLLSGGNSLNWTAAATSSWLSLSPTAGSTPASFTLSPDTSISGPGTFNDTLTITAASAGNSPLQVPVTMQVGSLLFQDDFTSGAANWTISPLGNATGWSVVNGAYTYNGGGHTQSYAGSTSWTDYTVSADVRLSSVNDYPGGLRGRVNTATGSSYGVWIYPEEGVLKLFRIGQWNIDADLSLLGQSGQLPMDTNWHNIRLVFQGTSIKVFFDNTQVIAATDSSYAQGAVALDVSDQPIAFDNVTVISLP